MNEALEEELAAVESILSEESIMKEEHPDKEETDLHVQLHPLTGCQEEKKFVSLVLHLTLDKGYPDQQPVVKIKNPRGLSDNGIEKLLLLLNSKCSDFVGHPVIFELIDVCHEFLTESNVPACACAICLYDIVDDDIFHKTVCYHYFHNYCLARYVKSMEEQHQEYLASNPSIPGLNQNRDLIITCPVCRDELDDIPMHTWTVSPSPKLLPSEEADQITIAPEVRVLQQKMSHLFLKQKANGSIIDDEEEDKKFLVSIASSSNASSTSQTPDEKPKNDDHVKHGTKPQDFPKAGGSGQQQHYAHQNRARGRFKNSHGTHNSAKKPEQMKEDFRQSRDNERLDGKRKFTRGGLHKNRGQSRNHQRKQIHKKVSEKSQEELTST